jgi:hypothetical protein
MVMIGHLAAVEAGARRFRQPLTGRADGRPRAGWRVTVIGPVGVPGPVEFGMRCYNHYMALPGERRGGRARERLDWARDGRARERKT